MKILHISTSDIGHGAGVSAYRLHDALRRMGADSKLLVKEKLVNDDSIISFENPPLSRPAQTWRYVREKVDFFGNLLLPQNYYSLSSHKLRHLLRVHKPEVINLHAIHGHRMFFPLGTIAEYSKSTKFFWTLHDMWAFTGHCTYSYDCDKWEDQCVNCEYLRNFVPLLFDTSSMNFRAKRKTYQEMDFTVVAPSRWLCDLAKASPLLASKNVIHIPYGIDTDVFFPRDKDLARRWLGIPPENKVILGIAHDFGDPRKGAAYLEKALVKCKDQLENVSVMLIGRGSGIQRIEELFHLRSLGYVSDPWLLATIYSAADILVFPTLADNLPNVVLESMACGTPVVSFDVGGLADMVEHDSTGYLAKYCDEDDLAKGILQILNDKELRSAMTQKCVTRIEQDFPYTLQAKRYLDLYSGEYVVPT